MRMRPLVDKKSATVLFYGAVSAYAYFVAFTPLCSVFAATRVVQSLVASTLFAGAICVFRTTFYDRLFVSTSRNKHGWRVRANSWIDRRACAHHFGIGDEVSRTFTRRGAPDGRTQSTSFVYRSFCIYLRQKDMEIQHRVMSIP